MPLTHIVASARAVMIDGESLWAISIHLVVLIAMTLTCLFMGAFMFRWE